MPYHTDRGVVVNYGRWLEKFCVSLSWRVLFLYRSLGLQHLTATQQKLAGHALATWREFLLDHRRHPGAFEQHILPVDVIAQTTMADLPNNINRFLTRCVELDVVSNSRNAFVYAKMGSIIVLGFIQLRSPGDWHGTKVAVQSGTIRPREYVVPGDFGDFLLGRARRMDELQSRYSARQQARINAAVLADPERAAKSDTFRAIDADVRLFGRRAFRVNPARGDGR